MTAHPPITRPIRAGNPPGLSEIRFRLAAQPLLMRWMLSRLRQAEIVLPDGTTFENPLRDLNLSETDSFVPALVSAWAAIGDVLTFYQERIANEGYLATATETFSVRALLAMTGYTPRPALSAQSYLAFTLIEGKGAPERLIVPKGTAVRSVPPPGGTSVQFETDRDIEARIAWNAMAPQLPDAVPMHQITGKANRLWIVGAAPVLRVGMPILLHGKPTTPDGAKLIVRELTRVEPNRAQGATLLGWQKPLDDKSDARPFETPELVAFKSSARLFGATAGDWAREPASLKARIGTRIGDVAIGAPAAGSWTTGNRGLPPEDVRALAIARDGMVFAATATAMLRHATRDGDWTTLGPLPRRSSATALIVTETGTLFAGSQSGDLFASIDRGASWFGLGGSSSPAVAGRPHPPLAPIRALAIAPPRHGQAAVIVGSAFGIWSAPVNGGAWTPWNDGLPGYDSHSGGAAVTVNALAHHPSLGVFVAATDQGLFYAAHIGANWHAASIPAAPIPPQAPVHPAAGPASPGSPAAGAPAADAAASTAPTATADAVPTDRPLGFLRRLFGADRSLPPPSASDQPSSPSEPSASPPASADSAPPATAAAAPATPAQGSDGADDQAAANPQAIHGLAVVTVGPVAVLLAGTSDGVLRSPDGRVWHLAGPLDPAATNAVLALGAEGRAVMAGTSHGLFRSLDGGETWTRSAAPFAATTIVALAVGGGRAAAAARFGGYREQDWPGLAVSGAELDLDRAYAAPVPGSWILLAQGSLSSDQPQIAAARVASVATVMRRDFQLNGRVTRVILDKPLTTSFDPRTTTVYLYSRTIELFRLAERPVAALGAPEAADDDDETSAASPDATRRITLAAAIEDLAQQFVGISGRRARARLNGRAGGVRRYDGKSWVPVGSVMPEVRALLATSDGRLLLGTDTGVYGLAGTAWRRFGGFNNSVEALAEAPGGVLFAGGADGLFRFADNQWTECALPGHADRAVFSLLPLDDNRIVAGTDSGIVLSDDAGVTWQAATGAVMETSVYALARGAKGEVIAGTDQGVFIGAATDWSAAVAVLGERIQALVVDADGGIAAATPTGVYTSPDGRNWQADPAPTLQGDIRVAALDPRSGTIYFARRGIGVVTRDGMLPAGLANDIRAMVFDHAGNLHAGSLSATVMLSTAQDGMALIEPTSVVDIDLPGEAALESRLVEGSVSDELRHAFTQHGITLPDKGHLHVDQAGQSWNIGGETGTYLLRALRPKTLRVFLQSDLDVMAPPRPVPGQPGLKLWQLRARNGTVGAVMAADVAPGAAGGGEIGFTSADPKGETVSEIGHIVSATIATDRSRTELVLSAPLINVYDAATVVLNANVAPASHGETPALYEVLGSGDNSKAHQRFVLKRKPITAFTAASPPPFYSFDIIIRVRSSMPLEPVALSAELRPRDMADDSVEWTAVETLSTSGPNDRHYTLEVDEAGTAIVAFGDGSHGMRLPTGRENVIALYRTGSGPAGNVAPGSLTVPFRRPPGVRRVTNPAAAHGGLEPEPIGAMRQSALSRIRNFGRIVSLRDYEDFVGLWPGVGKVLASVLPGRKGRGRLLHVTVAGASETSAPPDIEALARAIDASRTERCPVRIDPCLVVPVKVEAEITPVPDTDWDGLKKRIQAALVAHCGFAARDLAAPLHAADLVALIQDVSGVKAVRLNGLYVRGRSRSLQNTLTASMASPIDGGAGIRPAELLILASGQDIDLTRSRSSS
jgi:hypothetical protein